MDKTKIGLIGCGMISEIYLKNINERFGNLRVVACADLLPETAQKRAGQFGIRACSVDELLADPEIEVVLNLTVPAEHAGVSLRAIRAGKHAYSEKPFATDLDEGRQLLAAAKSAGLLVGSAPDTFLGAGLQTCRKLIDDGEIGQPIAAQAFMLSRGPETFHPNPAFLYQKGAGPLMDWGPYYITALVALLGPVHRIVGMGKKTYEERTVLAKASPKCGEKFPVEVPTYVTCILEMESGVLANLTVTFDLAFPYFDSKLPYIQIFGTTGSLTVPDTNMFGGPVVLRQGAEEPQEVPLSHGFAENSRGMGLADMVNAIRTGDNYRPNGELALHVTEVLLGVQKSIQTGRAYAVKSTCEQPEPLRADLPAYLYR